MQTDGTTTFNTARFNATTNTNASSDLVYYIDASDAGSNTSFILQSWADNAGTADDDILMDINPANGNMDLSFTYSYSTPLLLVSSIGDHSREWIGPTLGRQRLPDRGEGHPNRSHTIVVNGTGNNSYGLDKVGNGYRYSADEQVYVLDLTCSGSDGIFHSGMNTIILPRSIAVYSLLNQSLSDPSSIISGDPLYGATFAYTNRSAASSSGHVIAVISQSLTYQGGGGAALDADARTGNAIVGQGTVIEDPSMLYLMHLPKDILRAIPIVNLQGSALGGDVNIIDFVHYIVGIAEFVYNGLVAGANLMVNFAKVMMNMGMSWTIDADFHVLVYVN